MQLRGLFGDIPVDLDPNISLEELLNIYLIEDFVEPDILLYIGSRITEVRDSKLLQSNVSPSLIKAVCDHWIYHACDIRFDERIGLYFLYLISLFNEIGCDYLDSLQHYLRDAGSESLAYRIIEFFWIPTDDHSVRTKILDIFCNVGVIPEFTLDMVFSIMTFNYEFCIGLLSMDDVTIMDAVRDAVLATKMSTRILMWRGLILEYDERLKESSRHASDRRFVPPMRLFS